MLRPPRREPRSRRARPERAIERNRLPGRIGEPMEMNGNAERAEVLRRDRPADATGRCCATHDAMRLSGHGYRRVLRVARTFADLDGTGKIGRVHLAEALSYRALADESAARREALSPRRECRRLRRLIAVRNSCRVSAWSRNTPSMRLVTRLTPVLCTPRVVMQSCVASITTATPCGLSTSLSAVGDLRGHLLLDLQALARRLPPGARAWKCRRRGCAADSRCAPGR